MVTSPILVFLDWEKSFDVNLDTSSVAIGEILAQPRVGDLDHPISFARRKVFESD